MWKWAIVVMVAGCVQVERDDRDDPPVARAAPAVVTTAAMAGPVCSIERDAKLDERSAARALFQAGVKAYDEGHFGPAAGCFLAANELVPMPPLDYNIGQAFRAAGDHARARFHFQRYLDSGAANPAASEQVRAYLAKP